MDADISKPARRSDPVRDAFDMDDLHEENDQLRDENTLWRVYAAIATLALIGLALWQWAS